MKKYAIAPIGDYIDIIPNKKYEIVSFGNFGGFWIFDESKNKRFCILRKCSHIDNKNWKII